MALEKRYQVFISSTFQDLENARQEVSQALLRANCFPAGMELFPAADEEQFDFIKSVIDESDYYIIISAGRYGSTHPVTGLSYTEMEYDYAVKTGKPVIRLLHKDPRTIADEGDSKLAKLMVFREKMKAGKLVGFWTTADQLGKEVTFALNETVKRYPAKGWVRSTVQNDPENQKVIERLREETSSLRAALAAKEGTDFEEILGSISGTADFEVYEFDRWLDRSDFPPGSSDAEITIRVGLEEYAYGSNWLEIRMPGSEVITRLSYGLLFSDDFQTAMRVGFSTRRSAAEEGNVVLIPISEQNLEPFVMSAEGAGLIRPTGKIDSLTATLFGGSQYLRKNGWELGEQFRRWLVSQSPSPYVIPAE